VITDDAIQKNENFGGIIGIRKCKSAPCLVVLCKTTGKVSFITKQFSESDLLNIFKIVDKQISVCPEIPKIDYQQSEDRISANRRSIC
jgi:hypothetical protein